MNKKKEVLSAKQSQESQIAQIIVDDTIKNAYSNDSFEGITTIEEVLDLLKSSQGEKMASDVVGRYCGSLTSLIARPSSDSDIDMRVMKIAEREGSLNVSSSQVRTEMIKQLEEFTNLPESDQQAMVDRLFNDD